MQVVPVETRAQWRDFHRLPHRVYANDSRWVAPLLFERKLHFSPKHNAYFQHARAAYWLAYEGDTPVGRISAQIDDLHLSRHNDATGHFGFIEAIDDPRVFKALLDVAENWLMRAGLRRAVGPVSFSMWDQAGLLVEGFDTSPYVMMGHALPYFAQHVEAAGYRKAEDLIAYSYGPQNAFPPAAMRILERARRSSDIRVRSINRAKAVFESEITLLLNILNDAWSHNWGFVPMTSAEMTQLADVLKLLVRPGDVAIAEYRGEPAAFAAVLPNINEAIRDLNGRLAPIGWAKLLWRLKVTRTRTARMALMGVRRAMQDSPVGAALALSVIQATRDFNFANGVMDSELSWVLEGNERARHIIGLVGASPYKRYRVYEKRLAAAGVHVGNIDLEPSGRTAASSQPAVTQSNGARAHAILTGGSSGIGLALARKLAATGYNVTIIARRVERLESARAEIERAAKDKQQRFLALAADVTDAARIAAVVGAAIAELGTPSLVVANAGIVVPGVFLDLSDEAIRQTLEVNYFGTVHLLRAALPSMSARKAGHVVLVSSGAGLIGVYGLSSYSPTKFAVRGLGEALRSELAPEGIGVSVVFPPDTDTEQLHEELKTRPPATAKIAGGGRVRTADEVADAIIRGVARKRFIITSGLEMAVLARAHSLIAPLLNRLWFDPIVARHHRRKSDAEP